MNALVLAPQNTPEPARVYIRRGLRGVVDGFYRRSSCGQELPSTAAILF